MPKKQREYHAFLEVNGELLDQTSVNGVNIKDAAQTAIALFFNEFVCAEALGKQKEGDIAVRVEFVGWEKV